MTMPSRNMPSGSRGMAGRSSGQNGKPYFPKSSVLKDGRTDNVRRSRIGSDSGLGNAGVSQARIKKETINASSTDSGFTGFVHIHGASHHITSHDGSSAGSRQGPKQCHLRDQHRGGTTSHRAGGDI